MCIYQKNDYKFSFDNFDNIAERSWVLPWFWWFKLTFAELPGSAPPFSRSTVFVSCCDKYFPYERSYIQINDGMIFLGRYIYLNSPLRYYISINLQSSLCEKHIFSQCVCLWSIQCVFLFPKTLTNALKLNLATAHNEPIFEHRKVRPWLAAMETSRHYSSFKGTKFEC